MKAVRDLPVIACDTSNYKLLYHRKRENAIPKKEKHGVFAKKIARHRVFCFYAALPVPMPSEAFLESSEMCESGSTNSSLAFISK